MRNETSFDLFQLQFGQRNRIGANPFDKKGFLTMLSIRGAILRQIRIFFEHCSKGGGSNPCSKNMLQILYDYKGLLAT